MALYPSLAGILAGTVSPGYSRGDTLNIADLLDQAFPSYQAPDLPAPASTLKRTLAGILAGGGNPSLQNIIARQDENRMAANAYYQQQQSESKRGRALEMLKMLQREREIQGREPAAKPNPLIAKTLAGAQAGGYPDITARVLSGDMTPEEAAVELSTRAQAEKDQAAADKAAEKAQKEADRKAAKAESDLKTGGLSPGQMRKVTAVRAAIKVKLSRLNRELTPLQDSLEFRLKISQDPEHDPSVTAAQARVNAKLDEIQALEHDFEKAGNVTPEPPSGK